MSFISAFQWLPLILLLSLPSAVTSLPDIAWLNTRQFPIRGRPRTVTKYQISKDYQTFYYTQTIDHFNYRPESYTTFQQKYVINFKYWGGASACAPIFAYLGAESPLDDDLLLGFLSDNAAQFKALLVYMEHRYYGKSVPFGSFENALKNASIRGNFDSAQALADYAEIFIYLKEKLHAQYSPVIVIGGSYGGMLASWFRLKYPHVALGALASSAPILNFDDITSPYAYFSVVSKDFREASEMCYQTIVKSWTKMNEIASKPEGLSDLSKKFRTCKPLTELSELTQYLINDVYASAAQYDAPPTYPVAEICRAIDGAALGNDILARIFAGVVAFDQNSSCYVNPPNPPSGWGWQCCSEMVIPQGIGDDTIFPPRPYNLSATIEACENEYGVKPRPHWVTTYFGGHDIKLILKRFASNIIFSNGLRDPYSTGGVLENISDTVVAVYTVNGSHCLDIYPAQPTDPDWLIEQRKIEVDVLKGWITKYYADLQAYKY